MTELLYTLALLACPLGMGAMMWFMMRGGKRSQASAPVAEAEELRRLRAELDELREERATERNAS